MATGKFIIFEGNEGTGKSTHITFAANYLKKIDEKSMYYHVNYSDYPNNAKSFLY